MSWTYSVYSTVGTHVFNGNDDIKQLYEVLVKQLLNLLNLEINDNNI